MVPNGLYALFSPPGNAAFIALGGAAIAIAITLIVVLVTGISGRRGMRQALRQSEQQLRSLVGNMPGVCYRCLPQEHWPAVFISDAVESLTGYPPSDFVGPRATRRFIDLVHPDDRESLRSGVEEAIRESKPYVLEYRLKHRDGRERYLRDSGCAVNDGDGRRRFLYGVILDMTERRQMEQELRAARERAEQAAGLQRNRSAAALPPLRILAVDDAPQNLELLTLLLGAHGHSIVPACNAREAVRLAAREPFDVVLMDVQMPDMDGHAATRAIRTAEAARGATRVPVVALSASVLSADRRAALEAGMDAFASKPIDFIELCFEIARALGDAERIEQPPPRPDERAQLLDIEQGLARWGGQQERYFSALRHFAVEYAKLPTLLSSYGVFGGASEARLLAHRVKDVAGNLGLGKLAELLEEIEHNLAGDAPDVVAPLLARLRHLIYDSFAAIDFELAKAPAPTVAPRTTRAAGQS
jgi:PAS domain S-box-containing protein